MLFPTMTALALLSLSLALIHAVVSISIVSHLIGGVALPKWNFSELRSMAGFGGWAYLGSLSSLLMNGLDKIVLTNFLGSASLPYYVIGQRVVQRVHALISGQSQFLFPMLASQGERTSAVIKQVEDRLRWFLAFISATLYGVFAALAWPFLSKVIGPEFAYIAIVPFMLACFQGFLVALNIAPYQISWAEGRGAPNAVASMLTGILVLGTTILLAPKMGVLGASLAQLWIGVTSFFLLYWVAKAGQRFSWWGMFRPLISPVIMLICSFVLTEVAWSCRDLDIEFYLMIVGIGGVGVILIGVFTEKLVFSKYRCLRTLKDALGIVTNKLIRFQKSKVVL